jgi:hypothetical protein
MVLMLKTYLEILKAAIFVLLLVALGGAVYKGAEYFRNYQAFGAGSVQALQEKLDDQNRKYLALSENVARAQTEIVSKINADQAKVNERVLELIKANNEQIRNIGTIQTSMNEALSRRLRVESDHEYKAGTGDPNEQYFKKIVAASNNEKGEAVEIPVAWAIYFPNREPEKRWKTGIYPLDYFAKIVQAEQSTGQWNTYVEAWAENNKDPESRGEKLPLKVNQAEFKQVKETAARMFWWNPKLDFGVGWTSTNSNEVNFGLGFSAMGYGRTENDLKWRFLRVAFMTDSDFENYYGSFSPVGYNLGELLPVISNFWLFPELTYSQDGTLGAGLSLSFMF